MDSLTLARTVHILSVVVWIGGVTFVTIILIPILRKSIFQNEQLMIFNTIENQFAVLARVMVLLTGLSGLYMTYNLDAWNRFAEPRFFWMHAMVFIWGIFFLALFIIEPFFLKDHGRLVKSQTGVENLRKTQWVHAIILTLSLATIAVSVLGAHGFF